MDLTQYDEKIAGNGMNLLRMGGFIFLGVGLLFLSQFATMALLLLGLVGVIRRRRAGKEQP